MVLSQPYNFNYSLILRETDYFYLLPISNHAKSSLVPLSIPPRCTRCDPMPLSHSHTAPSLHSRFASLSVPFYLALNARQGFYSNPKVRAELDFELQDESRPPQTDSNRYYVSYRGVFKMIPRI